MISPILANLYLHYVLDRWVEAWRKKRAHGDVIIVRYADDAVLGFEHREDAEQFLEQLRERLAKFGLELHPEKTRLIEFGRFAAERRKRRGEGKPETFNFLGFTHICGTNYQTGKFAIHRKTIGKRMAAKLKDIRAQLRKRMHARLPETGKWLQQVVRGYFQYHAIPGNSARLRVFRRDVLWSWLQTLRRQSQKHRMNWERVAARLDPLLPSVKILHPYPDARFAAKYPNILGRNRVRYVASRNMWRPAGNTYWNQPSGDSGRHIWIATRASAKTSSAPGHLASAASAGLHQLRTWPEPWLSFPDPFLCRCWSCREKHARAMRE